MSEQAPDRLWSGIQISKVIAGTLAAVTAAVLGSFLGVAGTLAGAALASVVGSVGTEIFNNSLKRSTKHLQTVAPAFIKAPAAVGTPPVAAAAEEEKPSHTVVPEPGRFAIRWKTVALGAAAVFVIAMGAIFAVEVTAGRSLASMTGHGPSGGNTFSNLVSSNDDTSKEKAPSTEVSESPSDDASSTPDTSSSEAPATGTPEETPATTEPTTEPTTEATTQAPQTPPADEQQQQPDQEIAPQQEQDSTTE
ncbi:hypothetical protein AB0J80_05470 [Actinoplanes sp. NPDC049548]|uniref:hypothetical protein n=1 Tax=Actinoplanes sp. NPDC049548 TaxID=3155152 RepID=UPI0034351B02